MGLSFIYCKNQESHLLNYPSHHTREVYIPGRQRDFLSSALVSRGRKSHITRLVVDQTWVTGSKLQVAILVAVATCNSRTLVEKPLCTKILNIN